MNLYINKKFDEERALYGIKDAQIKSCIFAGERDGESALKETANITAENCDFMLRYPFWHTTKAVISNCSMTETCRAALWYDRDITITNSKLNGIKAIRECKNIYIKNCKINSTEFGWFCKHLNVEDSELISEYPFLQSSDMDLENLTMTAKYSFQYTKNVTIRNSDLTTKDAFWHSKNVTVYDSVIKGEYLGWYSENLHLIRCKIIGTQPLCYANGLILEDCQMIDCDLSFENSNVTASISGGITSVKNPLSGSITADNIGNLILDTPKSTCKINISGECIHM